MRALLTPVICGARDREQMAWTLFLLAGQVLGVAPSLGLVRIVANAYSRRIKKYKK